MSAIFTTSFSYNAHQKNNRKRRELWLSVEYIQMKVLSDAFGDYIPWSRVETGDWQYVNIME